MLGIEGLLANELKFMGAENVLAENGRVFFEGTDEILARANLRCRLAERIVITAGIFKADSFNELFEKTKAINWENYISVNDKFPVTGRSLSSKLSSVPDCQKIIKKAIVDKLSSKYNISYFEETCSMKKIRFLILKDTVTIMIDTSGEGLHKRGYRAVSNDAPIKETLAAALAELSRVRDNHIVYDPCCGSGTILIEAALKALNIAPGLCRSFVSESWQNISPQAWKAERESARKDIKNDCEFIAFGSDIDENALDIARENAKKAGVADRIKFDIADIKDFSPQTRFGTVICNPPYGERLLDFDKADEIYKTMAKVFLPRPGYSYTVITPQDEFERLFGRKADKRRKLYNGTIPCTAYMYYK